MALRFLSVCVQYKLILLLGKGGMGADNCAFWTPCFLLDLLRTAQCAVYIVQFAVCSVQCTVCSVKYTVCNVQCAVCCMIVQFYGTMKPHCCKWEGSPPVIWNVPRPRNLSDVTLAWILSLSFCTCAVIALIYLGVFWNPRQCSYSSGMLIGRIIPSAANENYFEQLILALQPCKM